jgi:glutathione S-transferase
LSINRPTAHTNHKENTVPDSNLTLFVDSLYTSPYAMSVYITLVEKGLAFDLRTLNLEQGEQLQPDYAARSLTRKVPLLMHGDFRLNESSAITEYLEDLFPAPAHAAVYPSDIKQKAKARQIQAWLRSDLMPIRLERSTEVIFLGKRGAPLSPAARTAADKLFAAADQLIGDGAANLFGAWSIADADLALMLNRLVMHGDDVPQKLKDYATAQWQRASVQQWVGLRR